MADFMSVALFIIVCKLWTAGCSTCWGKGDAGGACQRWEDWYFCCRSSLFGD